MDEEEKEEDTKKLGIGKVFLMDIQQLLRNANSSANYGDYGGWRSHLDCVFRKCAGRLTSNEEGISGSIITEVDLITTIHSVRLIKDEKRKRGYSKKTVKIGKELTAVLAKYEMFIIKILDRLNWLVPAEKKPKKPQ